ncbi:MAG: hypothetical protein ACLU4N_07115 [Butyricimonas faecihominis]
MRLTLTGGIELFDYMDTEHYTTYDAGRRSSVPHIPFRQHENL